MLRPTTKIGKLKLTIRTLHVAHPADLRAPRFFWIDNDAEEIDRSLLRTGIAYKRGCPIFIAFATDELTTGSCTIYKVSFAMSSSPESINCDPRITLRDPARAAPRALLDEVTGAIDRGYAASTIGRRSPAIPASSKAVRWRSQLPHLDLDPGSRQDAPVRRAPLPGGVQSLSSSKVLD